MLKLEFILAAIVLKKHKAVQILPLSFSFSLLVSFKAAT